jgi:integrase/recombinase XerD
MSGEKVGRGYKRNLDAEPFAPMVASFDLQLRAERKSPKTVRTYVEAALWLAAEYLLSAEVTDWDGVTARHVQEHG